jgi:hypothetical protein
MLLHMAPAQPGKLLTVIHFGYNNADHTRLIAAGIPTPQFLQESHFTDPSQGTSQSSQTTPETQPVMQNTSYTTFHPDFPASSQSSHYIDTVWTDPIFAPVTEVRTSRTCTVDGNSVSGCTGSNWRWWLSNSGWFEYSHSMRSSYVNSGQAMTWTHNHTRNNTFCAFQETDIYFHNSEIDILGDGSDYAVVDTSDAGGCSGWLSWSDTIS